MPEGLAWPPTKEDLERLYLAEKLSAAKIAKVYGLKYKNPKVAESTVLYQLKLNGIRRRGKTDHVKRITPEIVDDWVKRYQAGESLKQIAKGKASPSTVFLHLRARGIRFRDKIQAQIAATTKHQRLPFSGDSLEKAYLMGLRYGDFDVVRHGRAIRVRVSTTHPAMAALFENLFSQYGYVHWYAREAPLTGFEWSLECDLDSSFEFLLEKVRLGKVISMPKQEFAAFLAGLIDAEGTIYLHEKTNSLGFEIAITSTDKSMLEAVRGRLISLGYHPYFESRIQDNSRLGYQREGEIHVVRLFRQLEVCLLLRYLNLRHMEKCEKSTFVIRRTCDDQIGIGIGLDEWDDWKGLTGRIRKDRDSFVCLAQNVYEYLHPIV